MQIIEIAKNRKAFYEYYIEKVFISGLVLKGCEIKSLRNGSASLVDSYVSISPEMQASVIGMHIAAYGKADATDRRLDEKRERKLLLNKSEIRELSQKVAKDGMTIIPIELYIDERGRAKLRIALAKGKHSYDKRESIKKRDVERQIRREKW